ncbi:MAG: CAP domain-containing protein [Planctomycetota bacterium JB042]
MRLVLAAACAAASIGAEVVPARVHDRMAELAARVARGGRADEVVRLVDVMLALDFPPADATRLSRECNGLLARARKVRPRMPTEGRAVTALARELAGRLDALDAADRARLARQIVVLDPTVDAAHEALGRVRVDGRWRPPGAASRRDRRLATAAAFVAARRLPVDVTIEPCTDPYALAVCGVGARTARVGEVTIHRACSEERLRRIAVATFQALAVAHHVVAGTTAIPPVRRSEWVTVARRAEYGLGLDLALERDLISPEWHAAHRELSGCLLDDRRSLQLDRLESEVAGTLFSYLCSYAAFAPSPSDGGEARSFSLADAQPCLQAGLQSWVCLSFLGTSVPTWAWLERAPPGPGSVAGPLDEARRREREERLRVARAGLVGYRSWLRHLAACGEAPAFRLAMRDEIGEVANELLSKSTFVFEYLVEEGIADRVLRRTAPALEENGGIAAPALFERELGVPLAEFEERWRDWFLPSVPGIAQRLLGDDDAEGAPTEAARRALDHLNGVRRATLAAELQARYRDVALDAELSEGARLHALYLDRNPDQKERWPDAHEQDPGRPGFSVEGVRAAARSVVAPDVRAAPEAIDRWMASFYHRLPLLEPNVVRIGFALEERTAVLDAASLRGPFHVDIPIVHPFAGERDVPLAFRPELPNPVPGEDQSAWGYPVTVQLPPAAELDVGEPEFELRRGGPRGAIVDAHVSTPRRPTNPSLAPAAAYALIPKRTLDRNTTYHVTFAPAEERGARYAKRWSFTTGGR